MIAYDNAQIIVIYVDRHVVLSSRHKPLYATFFASFLSLSLLWQVVLVQTCLCAVFREILTSKVHEKFAKVFRTQSNSLLPHLPYPQIHLSISATPTERTPHHSLTNSPQTPPRLTTELRITDSPTKRAPTILRKTTG